MAKSSVAIIAAAILLATPALSQFADRTQSTTPPPKFVGGEMPKCGGLSIPPDRKRPNLLHQDRTNPNRIQNIRLRTLIALAYPIDECRILWPASMQYDLYYWGPAWNVGYDRVPEANMSLNMKFGPFYDFEATFPLGTTESQRRKMLQSFLANRFKLRIHSQTVNIPVYSVYAKQARLASVAPLPTESWVAGRWAVWDRAIPAGSASMRMSTFLTGVNRMIYELDRPLVDRTGLDAYYTFRFSMPRDPITTSREAVEALKKQLGLIVEEETLPTEMLIVDHVEK